MRTQAAEQQAQLHGRLQTQHDECLEQQLQLAASDRAAAELRLTQQLDQRQQQLAEEQQSAKELHNQLTEAQAELDLLQSVRSEKEELLASGRNEVSNLELTSQLSRAMEEVTSLQDARKQLQQQLGERTIVLGQKAHQIALLTEQLTEARGMHDTSPVLGKPC